MYIVALFFYSGTIFLMRFILNFYFTILFVLTNTLLYAQNTVVWNDTQGHFWAFNKNGTYQLDHRLVKNYYIGNDYVVVQNDRKDVVYYYKDNTRILSALGGLEYCDAKGDIMVSALKGQLSVIEKGKEHLLLSAKIPDKKYKCSNSIVGFSDGKNLSIYQQQQIYPVTDAAVLQWAVSNTGLAYIAPSTKTLRLWKNGTDEEISTNTQAFFIGDDYLAYQSEDGKWWVYYEGETSPLPDLYDMQYGDSLIACKADNALYEWRKGNLTTLANEYVKYFAVSGNTIVWVNTNQELWGFYKGTTKILNNDVRAATFPTPQKRSATKSNNTPKTYTSNPYKENDYDSEDKVLVIETTKDGKIDILACKENPKKNRIDQNNKNTNEVFPYSLQEQGALFHLCDDLILLSGDYMQCFYKGNILPVNSRIAKNIQVFGSTLLYDTGNKDYRIFYDGKEITP